MGLPPYDPLYLYVARIPIEVMRHSLRFLCQSLPETTPSLLSVEFYITQLKEAIGLAIGAKVV